MAGQTKYPLGFLVDVSSVPIGKSLKFSCLTAMRMVLKCLLFLCVCRSAIEPNRSPQVLHLYIWRWCSTFWCLRSSDVVLNCSPQSGQSTDVVGTAGASAVFLDRVGALADFDGGVFLGGGDFTFFELLIGGSNCC